MLYNLFGWNIKVRHKIEYINTTKHEILRIGRILENGYIQAKFSHFLPILKNQVESTFNIKEKIWRQKKLLLKKENGYLAH